MILQENGPQFRIGNTVFRPYRTSVHWVPPTNLTPEQIAKTEFRLPRNYKTCLICKETFPEMKNLHFHIARKHKRKIADYYREFAPKFDLLTKKPLEFKNYDFYFGSYFNERDNMVKFFKEGIRADQNPFDTAREIIQIRHETKPFNYAPSTVETRTSILPSPILVEKLGIDYNQLYQSLQIKPRFIYPNQMMVSPAPADFNILIDTREQLPLKFDCQTIVTKLDHGDYTTRSNYNGLFIERKSLVDLCGTLSQGYQRFQKELDRAAEMSTYLVITVEAPLSELAKVGTTPETKFISASSEFLAHRVREICQRYPNVQFLFVNNRSELPMIIKQLFLLTNDIKTMDLQYTYDSKRFLVS